MTPTAIIRELAEAGIRITTDGHHLHVEAPTGTLTRDLRWRLVECKSELIAALQGMRGRLLTIARDLGLPDSLIFDLPESEVEATAEQVTWMGDADTAHKLLVFYLRSLAGVEPALPGSIAYVHQHPEEAKP